MDSRGFWPGVTLITWVERDIVSGVAQTNSQLMGLYDVAWELFTNANY